MPQDSTRQWAGSTVEGSFGFKRRQIPSRSVQIIKYITKIPQTTQRRQGSTARVPEAGSLVQTLAEQFEQELVTHVLDMQARFFGLSGEDVRSLAYSLTVKNGIRYPFGYSVREW